MDADTSLMFAVIGATVLILAGLVVGLLVALFRLVRILQEWQELERRKFEAGKAGGGSDEEGPGQR